MKKLTIQEIDKMMRGKIELKEYGEWVVIFNELGNEGYHLTDLQLHPDDVEFINDCKQIFDNMEERIKAEPDIDFEIVEVQKLSGIIKYAKLI